MTTMKQVKRTYTKPAMRTVALQHRMALLQVSGEESNSLRGSRNDYEAEEWV